MKSPLTIETMLRELIGDIYSKTSCALRRRLESNLNVMQCLTIHLAGTDRSPNGSEYQSARNSLMKHGYLYHVEGDQKGRNGKKILIYRLTDKGEAAHAEMQTKFQPIVDRTNNQLQSA